MHNVFKDKSLNDAFERDGYIVLDFIDEATIKDLLAGYSKNDDVMGSASFSSSLLRHDNNAYRKRVSQSIHEAFKPRTDALLDNHKWILGNYLIKYKSPEVGYDGEVPLHQDASLTDESNYYSINIWCPLVDTNSDNGTLQVIKGSHHLNNWPRGYGQGFNEKFPYAEHEDFIRDNYLIPLHLKAGQAIVCTTKLFHASMPNYTDNPRIVCSGVLVPAESPLRTYYYDMAVYKDLEAFEVPEDYYLNNPIFERPDEKLYRKIATVPIQYDPVDLTTLKSVLAKPYLHLGLEKPTQDQMNRKLTIRLPAYENQWQKLALDGLVFLLKQYATDLNDVKHQMHFPTNQGFSSGIEDQEGDIFQRALLADTLCDFSLLMKKQLMPIIRGEIDYLISKQRTDEVGGWSYFPDLTELPADTDDLAQIMQLFIRANQTSAVQLYCEKPLTVLLNHQANADGSFESWIIPKNNLSALQQMQNEWITKAWGTGADGEVLANFYYALMLYDKERFASVIDKGMQFLIGQMHPDGYWKSTWYFGNYYGTYVALKALQQAKSQIPLKIYNYLVQTQHADGGWGIDEISTPLQTAFALLGLYYIYQNGQKIDDKLLEKSLTYLNGDNYTWDKSPFIKMELGRASGFTQYVLEYGSTTITANFVAKATLHISALLGGQKIV
ncbi:MAG: phytanoyl-CoA dioxygenase family protein [Bacteroidota bacterium]